MTTDLSPQRRAELERLAYGRGEQSAAERDTAMRELAAAAPPPPPEPEPAFEPRLDLAPEEAERDDGAAEQEDDGEDGDAPGVTGAARPAPSPRRSRGLWALGGLVGFLIAGGLAIALAPPPQVDGLADFRRDPTAADRIIPTALSDYPADGLRLLLTDGEVQLWGYWGVGPDHQSFTDEEKIVCLWSVQAGGMSGQCTGEASFLVEGLTVGPVVETNSVGSQHRTEYRWGAREPVHASATLIQARPTADELFGRAQTADDLIGAALLPPALAASASASVRWVGNLGSDRVWIYNSGNMRCLMAATAAGATADTCVPEDAFAGAGISLDWGAGATRIELSPDFRLRSVTRG